MLPERKKWIRGNSEPHVNKALGQVTMKRSRLKNKTNKTKDHTDIRNIKNNRIML